MKTKNYVDGMLSFICMYGFIFHRIDISPVQYDSFV